eukprot:7955172-Alexandrium_andersonii.AAC.1
MAEGPSHVRPTPAQLSPRVPDYLPCANHQMSDSTKLFARAWSFLCSRPRCARPWALASTRAHDSQPAREH